MSNATVEEIKSRLDIVDVVRDYIELKPAGVNMKARCPFHNEKTPSFMVSRDRQMYHCFGCGENGDIFTFVEKMEGIEFPETLRLLAKRAGVVIKNEDPRERNEKTKLFDILKFSARFFQEHLRRLPPDHPVKKYIAARGLQDHTIETFQIGFAPDSWDALGLALQKKNVKPMDSFAAGLLVRKDNGAGFYDRFRGRLMFPVSDAHGNIVGFGGRIIPEFDAKAGGKEAAKYINTPQSPVYNKSAILYGLHLAKAAIRKEKKVVVVEGYMDCIACHQAGSEFVVAASGTAFTESQAKLLKRFTDTVIVAFDMDEAGVAAASRGVQVLLAEGLTVRVLSLPSGKDPDELIRKDPSAWKRSLEKPLLFMDFAFEHALLKKNVGNVDDKKQIAKMLLPLIAGISNAIEQAHYIQQLAESLGVEESVIRQALKQNATKEGRAAAHATSVSKKAKHAEDEAMQELFSIIIKKPDYFAEVIQALSENALPDGPWKTLYTEAKNQYTQNNLFDYGQFRERIAQHESGQTLLEYINVAELGVSRLGERPENSGRTITSNLMQTYLRLELNALSKQIAQAEKSNETARLQNLITSFERLTQELKRFTF